WEFYDIAGIPSDFEILDDAESPMWVAAQFEKAIAAVDPAIVHELGYTWLSHVLRQLMSDPLASETALDQPASSWPAAIDDAVTTAVSGLMGTDAWSSALQVLPSYSGAEGDMLENSRLQALDAIANIQAASSIGQCAKELAGLKTNVGTAKNWLSA